MAVWCVLDEILLEIWKQFNKSLCSGVTDKARVQHEPDNSVFTR